MRPTINRPFVAALLVGSGVLALLIAPVVLGPYYRYILVMWLIMSISAVGLNVPLGHAELYSFGHGAFMLIGAYTTALLVIKLGLPFGLAFPPAIALAGFVGLLVVLPALRLIGVTLAIVTFAFAYMLFHFVKAVEFTGGPRGLSMPTLAIAESWDGRVFCYFVIACFTAGLAAVWSMGRARTGRALRMIGANEVAAVSLGIDLLRYKAIAMVLSAAFGGAAGSLMVVATEYLDPEAFGPNLGIMLFAAVIIGGRGLLLGPVLGAGFITLVPELTQSAQQIGPIVYAVAFSAIAILLPSGLGGLLERSLRALGRRRPTMLGRGAR